MKPILFPWPDPRLCGNSRSDRRGVTAIRQQARDIGWWLAKDAGLKLRAVPLEIILTLQPPDKLWRDNDNVLTGMKPMIDGMFKYLNINDHLITDTHILRRERMPGGGVWVELKEIDHERK